MTCRISAEPAAFPGQHQTRTGITSRVTASPITICGRSSRARPHAPFRYVSDTDVSDRSDSPRSIYYVWARNGIPDLSFDAPTRVDLAVPLARTVVVPAGVPVALHMTNRSDESVVVQLFAAGGKPIFWLPIVPLPPRSRRLLPEVALPPGTYRLADIGGARADQARTLASIHAGPTA